ncbi:MAG: surface antigen [Alphaproteobacteria bacterium]|jgi:surface antigen
MNTKFSLSNATGKYGFPLSFARQLARLPMAAALVAALSLGACATNKPGDKQVGGTVLGAVAGGLAGSAFGRGTGQGIMIGLGTLLGAYIGSEAGQSLDRADRQAAQQVAHETFEYAPTGSTKTWTNPDSGNSGTVTPTKSYKQADGNYCREYQQTVTVGGKTQDAYGTACRQPDGSWKVVNN